MPIRRTVPLAALLAFAAMLPACAAPEREARTPPAAAAAAPVLETVRRQKTLEDCPEHLAPCATISLEYVELREGSDALRASLHAFLDTTVFAAIDENGAGEDPDAADALMKRFLDSYREFSESFPEAPGSWAIARAARQVWNDRGVLSLEFSEESYTGGAHPNAEMKLVSFDVGTGRRLRLADLFAEGYEEPLRALGEKAFRSVHGLEPGDDLVAAGFWFEDGRFALGDNFAVTAEGLRFHFNAYEVAPYAMGPTDLVLQRADLARWARPRGPLGPPSRA